MGKIGEHVSNLAVFGYSPQAYVGCVGKRHQHRHAVASETQEIESLEIGSKGPGADILDGPNTLVGIYNLLADLKSHTETPHRPPLSSAISE
jgi:hypothetical protein